MDRDNILAPLLPYLGSGRYRTALASTSSGMRAAVQAAVRPGAVSDELRVGSWLALAGLANMIDIDVMWLILNQCAVESPDGTYENFSDRAGAFVEEFQNLGTRSRAVNVAYARLRMGFFLDLIPCIDRLHAGLADGLFAPSVSEPVSMRGRVLERIYLRLDGPSNRGRRRAWAAALSRDPAIQRRVTRVLAPVLRWGIRFARARGEPLADGPPGHVLIQPLNSSRWDTEALLTHQLPVWTTAIWDLFAALLLPPRSPEQARLMCTLVCTLSVLMFQRQLIIEGGLLHHVHVLQQEIQRLQSPAVASPETAAELALIQRQLRERQRQLAKLQRRMRPGEADLLRVVTAVGAAV